jgi:hyaluronate lyase
VSIELEKVTRSRRVVRTSNPDTAVSKQVFGLTVAQPAGTKRALAYALVPNATESGLNSYRHGLLSVVANTPRLQAIRHDGLGLTGANTFTPGRHNLPGLSIDGPASVLLQRHRDRTITVSASDPTTVRDTITVNLWAQYFNGSGPGVQVVRTATGTRLTFTTHHTYGRSLTVKLLPAW